MACRSVQLEARHYRSVIQAFVDDHQEWRPSPDVRCRYDRRQRDYLWTFQPSALQALLGYIVTSFTGFSIDEGKHCAATIQWRAEHGISPPVSAPTMRVKVPDVLPGQLVLFA
jgi:hypothetical protein